MRLVDPLGECWTAEIGPILRQNCDNFMFFPIGINAVERAVQKKDDPGRVHETLGISHAYPNRLNQ